MEADRQFCVDDLWQPPQPLPPRKTLLAIAARCGAAWDMPDLAAAVTLAYNPRLRTTLGRAWLDERRVELNPRLLRDHPHELVPTLAHELAHVAVHLRYGRVPPHGRHFRTLMRAVNLSARATHCLPTAALRRRRKRYLYLHRCGDCGYSFVARGIRRNIYCRACGPDMSWAVFRAPDSHEGRKRLIQFRAQPAVET